MLKRLLALFYSRKDGKKAIDSKTNIVASLTEISAQATFLASKILDFCDVATNEKGEKDFILFAEIHDPIQLEQKRAILRGGLCLGLSHLFLFCCVISDLQGSTKEISNNLDWFKQCVTLLNKQYDNLSIDERKDLVEFCSLTMHFHNNMNLKDSLGRSIFNEKAQPPTLEDSLPFLDDKQYNHVFNVEFTGNHEVQFEPKMGERYDNDACPVLRMFSESPGPIYATISLITSENTHCVALFKTKEGECIFYNPDQGFFNVSLNNIEEIMNFKKWIYEESTLPLLGIPDAGFDVLFMKPVLSDKNSSKEHGVKI